MFYDYNKDEIKQSLTIDQVTDYLNELGGEPLQQGDNILTAKTICHCGETHKLYYYNNTHLFRCYTDCEEDSFDIFELVMKNKNSKHIFINLAIYIINIYYYLYRR